MNVMHIAIGVLAVLGAGEIGGAAAQDINQYALGTVYRSELSPRNPWSGPAPAARAENSSPDSALNPAPATPGPVGDPGQPAESDDFAAAPAASNFPNPNYDECCRRFCPQPACPCMYGYVEALLFMRNAGFRRQPIVVDPNTNTTFMSTSAFNPNFNPGLRAVFGMRLFGRIPIEFDYFQLFEGSTSAVATSSDPGSFLIFPGNLSGNVFVDMSRVQANYASSLQSFAINFPCCCGCCEDYCDECGCSQTRCQSVTWFGGFRFLNLTDRLNIAAQRDVAGAVENGSYNIRTANRLFGGQLGARVRRTRGRFGWEGTGWSGLFGNAAQQSQMVTDFPNFALRPAVSSSRGGAAFVGGGNLSALYLLDDVWNIRAGYSVLWLQGLALSPDQLDFNFANAQGGSQLHNNTGLVLHGINIGLEARW